jgi:(E)-4-hydroxy-3-methyl-but-2-enyl pyrophosphate reductase
VKVRLAKTAGFCMGVRRAMEITLSEANKGNGELFTYGPLIHNQQVLDLLRAKGVDIIEDFTAHEGARIIIRAHGISPAERERIRNANFRIIDATCPRVGKVQSIIKRYHNRGYIPAIFGDARHPEVIGLMGYGGDSTIVIGSPRDVEELPKDEQLVVVSQTTQDVDAYRDTVDAIRDRFPEAVIFDTICHETYKRQREVRVLASEVDSMVVVGGSNSGNTRRLYEISRSLGIPTFHVETESELERAWFSSAETVGVTAGASTPNWMIKKVMDKVKTMGRKRRYSFGSLAGRVLRFLTMVAIPESIGAFSLTYAGLVLSRGSAPLIYPLLALLYVYSMHVLNRFLDKEAGKYNDPGIALFYSEHRGFFLATALATIGTGIFLSLSLGGVPVLLFLALTLLGLAYSMPIIPLKLGYLGRYAKIKDLPGSKTLAEALAWGTISSLLPLIGWSRPLWAGTLVSFLFVSSMCYIRAGLFDILNMQGDLIVGKETLPIALGERRAVRLLLLVNGTVASLLMLAAAAGLVSSLGYPLIICFLVAMAYLAAYQREWIRGGPSLQGIVEGNLLFAGVLAFIWKLV